MTEWENAVLACSHNHLRITANLQNKHQWESLMAAPASRRELAEILLGEASETVLNIPDPNGCIPGSGR